ncbi:MAG: hypothetical protein WKG01_02005 [Kofleriaceae bacterium]
MTHLRWFALVVLTSCLDEPALEEVSSAVTQLLIESEDSTGAGAVQADATASGGAVLAMPIAQTVAQQTFTTAGTLASGSVRVRGEACNPWVRVQLDNFNVVSTQLSSTSWTTLPFSPLALPAGTHTIKFHYREGLAGCVLRYDQATLTVNDPPPPPPPAPPPVIVEAELATGAGLVISDPTASGGALRAFTAAYTHAIASFTTTAMTTGSVRLRAASCSSTPYVKVYIDGVAVVLTTVTSAAWIELPLGQVATGTHSIDFEYRYGSPPCQLQIDKATFSVP